MMLEVELGREGKMEGRGEGSCIGSKNPTTHHQSIGVRVISFE
jgi:hypothetical protein